MSPSLTVQKALRDRFVNAAAVTNLVPAANILDRNQRPAPDPSIILGGDDLEVQETGNTVARDLVRVFSTIHVWKRETSLEGVKAIVGALRQVIGRARRLDLSTEDFHCVDCRVESARFLRDPDGETSHGVLTVNCLLAERWSAAI